MLLFLLNSFVFLSSSLPLQKISDQHKVASDNDAANVMSNIKNMMENEGRSTKSLVASLENLDPASVTQVIQLVDELLAQSRADLADLEQASSTANTAFTDATNVYNAAVSEKVRLEDVISTANQDLAAQEVVVSDAINTKNTAEGAKTQAQDTLDHESVRLKHEIATLVQVLSLLQAVDLSGWQSFQGFYYKYDDTPRNFTEAREYCQSFGAEVPSVHSAEENNFVAGLAGGAWAWLGANDLDNDNNYTWFDGTTWDYSNWDGDQPEKDKYHAGFECVFMGVDGQNYPHYFRMWRHYRCNSKWSVVCKKH